MLNPPSVTTATAPTAMLATTMIAPARWGEEECLQDYERAQRIHYNRNDQGLGYNEISAQDKGTYTFHRWRV